MAPVHTASNTPDPTGAEARGTLFARRSWHAIAAVAVELLLAIVVLRLGDDALRVHCGLRAALAETEDRAERAERHTAGRAELDAEVAELESQRRELRLRLLPPDPAASLEARFEQFCADAELRFEGLSVQRPRQRGALSAVPCEVRLAGSRHQVPVLLDAFYAQEELLVVTGLDLEVVNFIDDRVTGTLRFEALQLGEPPPPSGEILRPFLAEAAPAGADRAAPWSDKIHRALDQATAQLEAEHAGLLAYESLTQHRDHYLAEWEQVEQLAAGRPQAQADVAQALPRLLRALTRSALGRAGFHIQPGGPVEMIAYD